MTSDTQTPPPAAAAATTTATTTATTAEVHPAVSPCITSQVAAVAFSIPSIRDLIFFYHAQIMERRLRLQITQDPVRRKELRRLARLEISGRPAEADFVGGPEYPDPEDKWDDTLYEDLWLASPDECFARNAPSWMVRRKWPWEAEKEGKEKGEEQKVQGNVVVEQGVTKPGVAEQDEAEPVVDKELQQGMAYINVEGEGLEKGEQEPQLGKEEAEEAADAGE